MLIPSLPRALNFTILPNGKGALIYDPASKSHVIVSQKNAPNLSGFKPSKFKIIRGVKKWVAISAVSTGSDEYILGLIKEVETKMYYLVSFQLLLGTKRMAIKREQFVGLHDTERNRVVFQRDENNFLYCIIYWSIEKEEETETIYHILKINIEESGHPSSTLIAHNISLEGRWLQPFIYNEKVHFFSAFARSKVLLTSPFEKKFTVHPEPSRASDTHLFSLGYEIESPPDSGTRFSPAQYKGNVYFYYWQQDKESGDIWALDLENLTWKQEILAFTDARLLKEHSIGGANTYLHISDKGKLYLHGNCINPNCSQKAHILIYQLANQQPNRANPSLPPLPPRRKSRLRSYASCRQLFNKLTVDTTNVQEDCPELDKSSEDSDSSSEKSGECSVSQRIENNCENFIPGEYWEMQRLGGGTFGVVHKCRDRKTRTIFASKTTIIPSSKILTAAKNEIRHLQTLQHKRIVEYYGYKEKEMGAIVIFTEFVPGGSLKSKMDKEEMPIKEHQAIIYIGQILEGLAYIHEKEIVHCDLKCDNLLLDKDHNIKICDFGLAAKMIIDAVKNVSYLSQATTERGTMHWMAPEIYMSKEFGRSADIWSLGCTIVEMLTRYPPYHTLNAAAFYSKNKSYGVKELIPGTSLWMQKFVSSLLIKDKAKRPHTGGDVLMNYRSLVEKR